MKNEITITLRTALRINTDKSVYCISLQPIFVYTNSADDLSPANNDDTGSIDMNPIPGNNHRNIKREALLVSILMDFMDKFYVSKKVISKRSQYEEVIVRDKTSE